MGLFLIWMTSILTENDIHGGWYTKEKEYIYGPDWLSDLGCYEDEKEKYKGRNPLDDDLDNDDYDMDIGNVGNIDNLDDNFKGVTIKGGEEDDFDYNKMMEEALKMKKDMNLGNFEGLENDDVNFDNFDELLKKSNPGTTTKIVTTNSGKNESSNVAQKSKTSTKKTGRKKKKH